MNWEAIGAISDFVAAAAVVITLIYLSVQIREAYKASKSHATLASVDMASRWRAGVIQDSEMAEILEKANGGAPLREAEQIRLSAFAEDIFIVCAVSYAVSAQLGALHEESGEIEYLWGKIERNKALLDEWAVSGPFTRLVSPEFRARIDEKVRALKSANTVS